MKNFRFAICDLRLNLVAAPLCGVVCAALLSACATTPQTGLLAQVQMVDDALAAKYNVPAPVVAKVRQTLGIPVAKDLPSADRILPVPWQVYYDVLDRNDQVVDVTGFHYGTTPRIRRTDASTLPTSVFNPAPVAPVANTATLENIIAMLGAQSNSNIKNLLP